MNNSQTVTYNYKFIFDNGVEKKFKIVLTNGTMNLVQPQKEKYPKWTLLNFFRCPNCPLDNQHHTYCPVATSLVDLVDAFKGSISFEKAKIVFESEDRTYFKHTALQEGLSSLIGIYMVTSGCPVMEKLKPMVRFHLPFATEEETMYRVISTYLLAQYFLCKKGQNPDWELKNLVKIYEGIRIVNKSFCKRLTNIKIEDSSINALVTLDCFADAVTFSINEDMLDEIELLFKTYLEK